MKETNRNLEAGKSTGAGDGAGYMTLRTIQKIASAIAVFATTISLGIAVLAGLQRAGEINEQIWSVALSVLMVLVSNGAPMFWRVVPRQSRVARVALILLWLVSLSMVLRGQAEFLTYAQQHAADRREQSVPVVAIPAFVNTTSGRDLTTITREVADVTNDLTHVESRRCWGECRSLRARHATLTAQLDALNTEAVEVKRHEIENDRLRAQGGRAEALRESRRANPLTSVVASWVGTTEARLDLLLDFACLVALEGTACFAWYLAAVALAVPGRDAVAPEKPPTLTENIAVAPVANVKRDGCEESSAGRDLSTSSPEWIVTDVTATVPVSEDERQLMQIHQAVVAGQLKRNLVSIRKFLECRQDEAIRLNRLYIERFGKARRQTAAQTS